MTDHAAHLLQIPPEGVYHLYYATDRPYDREYIGRILAEFDGHSQTLPAQVDVKVNEDEHEVKVWFTPDVTLPENDRARTILADLYGWHMRFYGSVVIDGLSEDQITGVLARA
jgi:hypothetical protein